MNDVGAALMHIKNMIADWLPSKQRAYALSTLMQWLRADEAYLYGLDDTGEVFRNLLEQNDAVKAPIFHLPEMQRHHPLLAQLFTSRTPQVVSKIAAAKLQQSIFKASYAHFIFIPGKAEENAFPNLFFILGTDNALDGDEKKQVFADVQKFADICANLFLISTEMQTYKVSNKNLSQSLNYVEHKHSRLKNAIPEMMASRIIGDSKLMQAVRQEIAQFADTMLSVLIQGETGTGKELVARELHELSARRNKPFIALNMAALPEALAEAELFGHVKGAFTGSVGERKGLIGAADGGTLFLDEIGDVAPPLQAKLLRVLQERRYRAIGSDLEVKSDFRLICASHRNIVQMMDAETFRADLYYRIAQAKIQVPALRERREDIHALAQHFIHQHSRRAGTIPLQLSQSALHKLNEQKFTGNIRELEGVIIRAIVIAGLGHEILSEHLGLVSKDAFEQVPQDALQSIGLRAACERFERQMIIDSLIAAGGNQMRAAIHLGVPRKTLADRMKRFEISGGY